LKGLQCIGFCRLQHWCSFPPSLFDFSAVQFALCFLHCSQLSIIIIFKKYIFWEIPCPVVIVGDSRSRFNDLPAAMLFAIKTGVASLSLLFLSAPFSAVSALPEPGLCVRLAQTSTWQASFDYHQQCKGYHPTYFEYSIETLRVLNVGDWYKETIHQIYNDHPQYRTDNITEVQVFARNMSGDAAFECNLLKPDCGQRATPRMIINHQQAMHSEWSNQTIMEKSRKVKLTLDMISTFNRAVTTNYVSASCILVFPKLNIVGIAPIGTVK
jgi:hypothetical protein